MKVEIAEVLYQVYLFPYIKVTYDKLLNGRRELIIGWINKEIIITR